MSGYQGHLLGGAVAGGACLAAAGTLELYAPPAQTTVALLAVAVAFALLPDVDTASAGRPWVYRILLVLDAGLLLLGHYKAAAALGLVAMLPALGKHRGWTHTWWAMVLVPAPLVALPVMYLDAPVEAMAPYYGAAVVGYGSHLLLDWTW